LRTLITGGCGFIGSRLATVVLATGADSVRLVDDLSVGTPDAFAGLSITEITRGELASRSNGGGGRAEFVAGDVLDSEFMIDAAAGMDVIVHLAAESGVPASIERPVQSTRVNVMGTVNCLEAARATGVKRFVFASSSAAVGSSELPVHEGRPTRPLSPYGASKLAGEGYCSAYYHAYGIETVALRFGNVYGPGSGHKRSVVAAFIRQALAGEPLEIYGDGSQTRDFVYVDDLVAAIRLATCVTGVGGEVFQIATGAETTVGELADILVRVLGRSGDNIHVRYTDSRVGDAPRNYSDTTKAREVLEWIPQVGLAEGLRRTAEWFQDCAAGRARNPAGE
jgi:UDP-glucose 4-epimerase